MILVLDIIELKIFCIRNWSFFYLAFLTWNVEFDFADLTWLLQNLDLSRYVASDCVSQVKTYDLTSVIVHQGGAGGKLVYFVTSLQ